MKVDLTLFGAGATIGFAIAMAICVYTGKNHAKIVKHTEAYYHPTTGDFTWPDRTKP